MELAVVYSTRGRGVGSCLCVQRTPIHYEYTGRLENQTACTGRLKTQTSTPRIEAKCPGDENTKLDDVATPVYAPCYHHARIFVNVLSSAKCGWTRSHGQYIRNSIDYTLGCSLKQHRAPKWPRRPMARGRHICMSTPDSEISTLPRST